MKDDPVRHAIADGIDAVALIDIADVATANYNVAQNEGIGNRSPLNLLRDHLESVPPTFFPRTLPPPTLALPELGIVVEYRTVRGNQKQGRRPYIQIDRVKYRNPLLSESFSLVNRQLIVHIRETDFRTVKAYYETGEELGILVADGCWGISPHTREIRKTINSLLDQGELAGGPGLDLIEVYHRDLASKAYRDAEKRPARISKFATKAAAISHATGRKIPDAVAIEPAPRAEPMPPETVQSFPVSHVWKTVVR